ncbi:MAG TPA: RsmE family RNA methyltransferase [Polyangiaceae bacterium]|nr:RsmE family RNA methyltransferase [Polyangiaceae bacterium]
MGQSPRAPLSPIRAGEQQLPRELATYLVRVLRLRAGDACVVFDPEAGLEAEAVLLRDVPAVARVSEPRAAPAASGRQVTLLQGLAKGDKPEQVLRAAVALGARRVRFVRTERSVAGAELRLDRLRAVMLDAARQCGRGDLPELFGPLDLEAGAQVEAELRYVLDPSAGQSLVDALRVAGSSLSLALAVGPEGGFSLQEQGLLVGAGFIPVRLGAHVLRTELAAIAALAVVAAHE